jgi:hypothetical protein
VKLHTRIYKTLVLFMKYTAVVGGEVLSAPSRGKHTMGFPACCVVLLVGALLTLGALPRQRHCEMHKHVHKG